MEGPSRSVHEATSTLCARRVIPETKTIVAYKREGVFLRRVWCK